MEKEIKSMKCGWVTNAHQHSLALGTYLAGYTIALEQKVSEAAEGKRGYAYDRIAYVYLGSRDLQKVLAMLSYVMTEIKSLISLEKKIEIVTITEKGEKFGFEVGEGRIAFISIASNGTGFDYEFTPLVTPSKLSDTDRTKFIAATIKESIKQFYDLVSDVAKGTNEKYKKYIALTRKDYKSGNPYNSNKSYESSEDDDSWHD